MGPEATTTGGDTTTTGGDTTTSGSTPTEADTTTDTPPSTTTAPTEADTTTDTTTTTEPPLFRNFKSTESEECATCECPDSTPGPDNGTGSTSLSILALLLPALFARIIHFLK